MGLVVSEKKSFEDCFHLLTEGAGLIGMTIAHHYEFWQNEIICSSDLTTCSREHIYWFLVHSFSFKNCIEQHFAMNEEKVVIANVCAITSISMFSLSRGLLSTVEADINCIYNI